MTKHVMHSGFLTQDYYGERFDKFGDDVRTLWNSQKSQEDRFRILAEIGSLHGSRVLDVGCGFGDFYGFLKAKGIMVEYTGIDMQPGILEEAKRRYTGVKFERVDLLEFAGSEPFDYVFASGIFGLKMTDQYAYLKSMMVRLLSLAQKGLAVNFLSGYTTGEKDPDSFYAEPSDLLALALSMTRRVILRHDYRDNDCTLYCYPQQNSS